MGKEKREAKTRRGFLRKIWQSAAIMVAGPSMFRGFGMRKLTEHSGRAQRTEISKIRQEVVLSGRWRFQVDLKNEGRLLHYFSPDFPTQDWPEVWIPRAFDDCAPGMRAYRGICWFLRQFEAPVSMQRRRVVVRFEGVNYNSSVWLNGTLLGENYDPFLPFEFPVDRLLRYGESNLIVVRVDNLKHPTQMPTCEYWLGQGGILRDVKLVATDPAWLRHIAITAEPGKDSGRLALRAQVVNERPQIHRLSLCVKIFDPGGQRMASFESISQAVEADQEAELTVKGEVPHVVPWSPEEPKLYTASVDLLVDGSLADRQVEQVGFRRIETREGRLWLNGKELFLMGFCRHEDSPRTGMAVDLETSRQDFLAIKEAGSNFVCLNHYPHDPGELHQCDELGLMVLAELPVIGWGAKLNDPYAGPGWNPADAPKILNNAERFLRKMIARDRNHPSIIFWCVSDEAAEEHVEVHDAINKLIKVGRQLDPTRLMTHASIQFRWTSEDEPQYSELDDVLCINGYPWGLYDHDPRDNYHSVLEKVAQWWKDELARLHARCPGKPIVIGQFGYQSIQNLTGPWGEDAQVLGTEAELKAIMETPYVSGVSLWIYAKHLWPEGCAGFDESPYGYVSRDRRTKMKAFSVVRNTFREKAESLRKTIEA